MLKTIKFLIGTAVALIIALILFALLLPHFIKLEHAKASLIQQVYKNTGRNMTVGKIRWSILPTISLEIKNVTLSNPDGFSDSPFATIHKANTGVKFRPLLHGKIKVDTISLQQVELNLIRRADGNTNWSDLLTSPTKDNEEINSKPTHPKLESFKHKKHRFRRFTIDDIAINDVQIQLHDAINHKTWDFQLKEVDSNHINFTGIPFPLIIDWNYNSNKLSQPVVAHLTAQMIIGPERQFTVNQIRARLNNLKMEAQLQISDMSDKTLRASIQMPTTNLVEFADSIGHPLPFADKSVFSHVAANVKLVLMDKQIDISQLTLAAEGATLNAQAHFLQLTPLQGNFAVDIDHLNLDRYALAAPAHTHINVAPTTEVVSTASSVSSLPLWLQQAILQGTIHVRWLKAEKIQIQNMQVPLQLANGVLTSTQTTANLYHGLLKANTAVDLRNATPKISFVSLLEHVDMNNFLLSVFNFNKFSGTGTLALNLHAEGNTSSALLHSLNGDGKLDVTNGSYAGFDIVGAINTASALFSKKYPINNSASASTSFTNMHTSFVVHDGVVKNDDLTMRSPMLNITGKGSINLINQKLNYTLLVKTIETAFPAVNALQNAIGGVIPLKLTGTLNKPLLIPDIKKIHTAVSEDKIDKVVNTDMKDVKKSLRKTTKKIEKLFK